MLIESLVRSSASFIVLCAAIVLVAASVLLHTAAFVIPLLPAFLALVGIQWARFNNGFNFHVATSPDGLRLHHGLLQTTAQTVPPGRVQAVRFAQPLLWRRRDWWRLEVNVAGYTGHQEDGQRGASDNLLLPVGTRGEALTVLSLVLPDLGVRADEPVLEVLAAGLTGAATPAASPAARDRPAGWTRSPGAGTASGSPTARCWRGAGCSSASSTSCRTSAPRAWASSRAPCSAGWGWRRSCCTRRPVRCTRGSST